MNINTFLRKFRIEIISNRRESTKIAIKHFKGKSIVCAEIGVEDGYNARDLQKALNIKKFHLIDICPNKKALKMNKGNEEWYLCPSSKADVPKCDFIYIDGNHEYKYVCNDLVKYWKLVEKGGIMAGHDIQYIGVSKAVLEFANKNKLQINFGDKRDWWIIKNEAGR